MVAPLDSNDSKLAEVGYKFKSPSAEQISRIIEHTHVSSVADKARYINISAYVHHTA